MRLDPSRMWRALFVVGGLFYFVGALFHPRGTTMADMLVDPAWIPAHSAVVVGFSLVTLGLVSFRRSVPVSPNMDRWLLATLVLAVLQIIEMGLHTMAYVDAGALAHGDFHGGLSTPVLTSHIWLSTLAFTPFAVAFLGLIWTGTRERVLGSPWILWLGMIGAVAYGTVMWLVFILQIDRAGVLFPIAHLAVPLWFALAGIWPTRQERDGNMLPDFNDDPDGLNRILESIPEFVMMIDRDGTIRYINRLEPGFSRDKVIGMHAETVILPGSIRVFREAFDRVLSGAETAEYEAEVTLPDGTGAWYRSKMAAYRSGGVVVGVVLVAANITELRLAQESAEALRRLLSICAWCDRIQGEAGTWESIETYLEKKEATEVSHGMCEDCYKRQMQELGDSDEADERRA